MERIFVNVGEHPIKELTIKLLDPKDIFVDSSLSKIFTQREGSDIIAVKPYFEYMLAAQAKASFSRFIVEKDKDCVYHHEEIIEVPDAKVLEEFIAENQPKQDAYNAEYKRQKESHPEWFETQMSVENIADYVSPYIKSDRLYIPKDLISIVDAYKFSNAYLKEIGKDESLPRTSKTVISNQFKEDWAKITSKIKEDTGVKTEAELKQDCIAKGYVKPDKKTRLKLSRQPAQNVTELKSFAESFAEFTFERELEKIGG